MRLSLAVLLPAQYIYDLALDVLCYMTGQAPIVLQYWRVLVKMLLCNAEQQRLSTIVVFGLGDRLFVVAAVLLVQSHRRISLFE